jgi:hypothetical protein
MIKCVWFLTVLVILSACGQSIGIPATHLGLTPPIRVWPQSGSSATDDQQDRPSVDGQVVVLGRQVATGWEYCYLYVGLINDRNYLDGVVTNAQAELARAEAERIRRREAAIDSLTQEIRVEVARLRDRLQSMSQSENILRQQVSLLRQFESERRVDESFIVALRSVAKLLNVSVSEIFSRSVSALGGENFASGGTITIVRNENGEAVFRDGSGEKPVDFHGGTIAEYLQVLSSHRLLPKSEKAMGPLRSAMALLQDSAKARYESAVSQKAELRAQTDASIAKLKAAIEKLRTEVDG